jgi:hypothetical protein
VKTNIKNEKNKKISKDFQQQNGKNTPAIIPSPNITGAKSCNLLFSAVKCFLKRVNFLYSRDMPSACKMRVVKSSNVMYRGVVIRKMGPEANYVSVIMFP